MRRDLSGALKRAVAQYRAGRPADAEASCRRILAAAPRQPDALSLLSAISAHRGELGAAERLIRDALAVSPEPATYWNNLGVVLKKQGRLAEAVGAYRQALARDPELGNGWSNLCDALRPLPPESFDPAIGRDLLACFSRDELPHQDLARTALQFLHGTAELRSLVALLDGACGPSAFLDDAPLRSLCTPLLVSVLERVLMPDPVIERVLTAARRALLDLVSVAEPARLGDAHECLAAALAGQCFLNEYVYVQSDEERDALAPLRATLEADARTADRLARIRIMVFGCYAPLHTLATAAALEATASGTTGSTRFLDVVRRQVVEPLEERRIAAGMPSLGAIINGVSRKVRAQYEDRPYPRWQGIGMNSPRPLPEVMAQLFPHLPPTRVPASGAVEVLVAGCGTGRHAIMSARRFAGARVLAVDLSRASLAYASRKADELGADTIEFLHGDILDLDRLDRTFDVIECVGVLHHMEDPERGLRTLGGLLRPQGLMKLGLYSEIARTAHAAARKLVGDRGYPGTVEGIRAARQQLMSLPADHPARSLAERADFYSMSGCRDLVFHVHERRFEVPEIGAMLGRAGLSLIGFEFTDSWTLARYRERFPDDVPATSLENWHRFERDNPATFAAMYAFWVGLEEAAA